MKPSAEISLDTRKKLASGKYGLKIRVGFHSPERSKIFYNYYAIGFEMFREEFKKLYTSRVFKDILDKSVTALSKAKKIIENNPYVTPGDFELMFTEKGNFESVQGLLQMMREEAARNGQVSLSWSYRCTSNSLTKFKGKILLGQVNPGFLKQYEEWMISPKKDGDKVINGSSYNTVGIYTRNIRTMFNRAIDGWHLVSREQYPFGRNRYIPPASSARKMALNEQQKDLLVNYVPENPEWVMYHDFWKLSFYCFGLNFSDIAHLRNSSIESDRVIRIYRAKTIRTKRIKVKLEIPITDEVQRIIRKYGSISLDPNAYVFNILTPGLNAFQVKEKIHTFIKDTNEVLKEITELLGIPKTTTYTARHTSAYIMKIKGVATTMIQEVLGHESPKTTQNYLGSFEVEAKMEAAKKLYSS